MNLKEKNISLKAILVVIAVGIWVIALQNMGIIPNKKITQRVYVVGGDIDADVSGSVSVDNTVDVNIEEVQARPIGSHKSYTIDGRSYHAIDIFTSNNW